MSIPSTQEDRPWFCSKCDQRKGATNHWAVSRRTGDAIEFMSWAKAVRRKLLGQPGTVLLCGQDCGHKELNEFYDTLLAKRVLPPDVVIDVKDKAIEGDMP